MKKENLIQLKRILTLYIIGFILVFGYAIARPCIDSLFLEHYSYDIMPRAWLITTIVSVFVIFLYNQFNQKLAILKLYGRISLICALFLAILLGAYLAGFVPAIFILYIWKEIYMVVLMETYWSFADIVFSISTARFTYGLAMAISSFGGVLGNLSVGPIAKKLGSEWALSILILLLCLGFVISYLSRGISDSKPKIKSRDTKFGIGLKILFKSRYLVPLALLILLFQIVVALIDLKFNAMLQDNFINKDMRTEALGQIHAAVNFFAIILQMATGQILRLFGIAATFQSIPVLFATAILSVVVLPKFALMVTLKISSKSLDYSLLRGVKEILYIPLNREEKTQGKGIIDIFIYRMARGISSLGLILLAALGLSHYLMEISLGLVLIWFVLATIIARRYHQIVSKEEEY